MTRIAFASCMSALANIEQPVWREVAAHQPDWLVLCGDNIYMDYFPNLNQSRPWSVSKFADEMQMRYALQFEAESFRNLVNTIPVGQVIGVWDDHDFAWNNCFGAEPSDQMFAKKKVATALYHHYFSELNKRPLASKWPYLKIDDVNSPPNGSVDIYRALDIPPFRTLLCDGRAYREKHPKGTTSGSLLGAKQEQWLLSELAGTGPFLLISGSTMTAGDDQSWDYYQDFFKRRFLPAAAGKVVVFMAGDVHENRLPPKVGDAPVEIVSSASVLNFPFNKRNFGILEVDGSEARVFLYKRGKIEHAGALSLETGAFFTTMEALLDDSVETTTPEVAAEQREAAIVELFRAR
jgi:hypothetical protein